MSLIKKTKYSYVLESIDDIPQLCLNGYKCPSFTSMNYFQLPLTHLEIDKMYGISTLECIKYGDMQLKSC